MYIFSLIFRLELLLTATALGGEGRVAPAGTSAPHADALAVAKEDPGEDVPIPVPVPSERALRYHRTGQYVWAFSRFWDVAVPLALLVSGASARLRDLARRAGKGWFLTMGVYVVLYLL